MERVVDNPDGMFRRLSKPARIATVVAVVATVGCEAAAVIVYRNSTDGQTPVLWMFILIYGVLAVGAIRVLDRLTRWAAQRARHS
jgi:hypothetical protein